MFLLEICLGTTSVFYQEVIFYDNHLYTGITTLSLSFKICFVCMIILQERLTIFIEI